MSKKPYKYHSQETIDCVLKNFETMSNSEIAAKAKINIQQVRGIYRRHGLRRTEGNGRFATGQTPSNKGKKMSKEVYEKAKATMFKKGSKPHNHKPVGSERITKDGYIEIKTKEPRKWELKHRVLWFEKNPPLKKDETLYFLDGNGQNVTLSNLGVKTRAQNMFENSHQQYPKEIIPSLVLVNKIKKVIQNPKNRTK